jgi:hypothetical protein
LPSAALRAQSGFRKTVRFDDLLPNHITRRLSDFKAFHMLSKTYVSRRMSSFKELTGGFMMEFDLALAFAVEVVSDTCHRFPLKHHVGLS